MTSGNSIRSRKNDILVLGMSLGVRNKVATLRKLNDVRNGDIKIEFIDSSSRAKGEENTPGAKFKLDTAQGRRAFVKTLALSEDQSTKLEAILENGVAMTSQELAAANKGTQERTATIRQHIDRNLLAQLMEKWAVAEHGGEVAPRVVIGGHGEGGHIYGRYRLYPETLEAVEGVLKVAAGQIEDLDLASCYSLMSDLDFEQWQRGLPNLKTAWGYNDTSRPSDTDAGAAQILSWERATRGEASLFPTEMFRRLAASETISTWTKSQGFVTQKVKKPIAEVRNDVEEFRKNRYQNYYSGVSEADAYLKLRDFYSSLVDLKSRRETPPEEKDALQHEKEVTFRLLKFGKSKRHFQTQHGARIAKAYEKLGLVAPDFSALSRMEAMATIAEFEKRASQLKLSDPLIAEARYKLTKGLRDFTDFELIPRNAL